MRKTVNLLKKYLKDYSIEANVVGEVTGGCSLYLVNGDGEKLEVFNQKTNPVFKSKKE